MFGDLEDAVFTSPVLFVVHTRGQGVCGGGSEIPRLYRVVRMPNIVRISERLKEREKSVKRMRMAAVVRLWCGGVAVVKPLLWLLLSDDNGATVACSVQLSLVQLVCWRVQKW